MPQREFCCVERGKERPSKQVVTLVMRQLEQAHQEFHTEVQRMGDGRYGNDRIVARKIRQDRKGNR